MFRVLRSLRPVRSLRSLRSLLAARFALHAFDAYRPLVASLPLAAVPLAHALVHATGGLQDGLRRWLDLSLSARAPTAIGQPTSRATIAVWYALQDAQATGLALFAEADWSLLQAVGRDVAALEAMRFLLRVHLVTVRRRLPGATEAMNALASSRVVWPDVDAAIVREGFAPRAAPRR